MSHCQGIDGHKREPLAIVGFSLKFPQDAVSEKAFWDMLLKGRMTQTKVPKDRLNIDGFHAPKQNGNDTFRVRTGCFLKEDIATFDAGFFSMSTAEATATDPLQRGLLETTYRALESAGMKIEDVAGSNTSVFVGCLSDDYKSLNSKDPERLAQYATTGVFDSMLANRLSWFYNFTGNSVTLDTACSSSLIALDLACQGLLAGESDMTVVAGCNLIFSPDLWFLLNGINVLSPDGISHSFDSRANGYGRGEGFATIIVKRLSDALRDNDTIRAVIRSTGSNQNGHTPSGITQTSQTAQESLMRATYAKAGLDMSLTQYVEAHATGTKFGDAVELKSIGRTFRSSRSSPDDPLHVGCVKPNIGHLEGASGLAGIIKTVLVLENGIIPPVAGFEKINIRANESYLRIKIPRVPTQWPTQGLRRASVNSFGVGGSNAHVILDDAYHFLEGHDLTGNTNTKTQPIMHNSTDIMDSPYTNADEKHTSNNSVVLVWSSGDESGISRLARQFAHYARSLTHSRQDLMSSLAYTLNHRRSLLRYRSFAVVTSIADLENLETQISSPVNTSPDSPRIGFVFTGQGAIWPKVARELCVYPCFLDSLKEAELYLHTLNCPWKITDELFKEPEESNVYRSEYSQPLSTVIQIALVDLLQSFGIKPAVVVGHSSGEIAAAYCSGAISKQSAWKISYYRGFLSAKMQETGRPRGAMLAVLLSEAKVLPYLKTVEQVHGRSALQIACYNSEENLTISGDDGHIDTLQSILTETGHRWHRLKVDVAYHSTHMTTISDEFLSLISDIERSTDNQDKSSALMVSTLTGTLVTADELIDPKYWVRNLVSPVRFHQAISQLCKPPVENNRVLKLDLSHRKDCSVDCLVEVGPHSALQGPIRSVLRDCKNTTSEYISVLQRDHDGVSTVLNAAGKLFCTGYPVDLAKVNRLAEKKNLALLSDLPQYPFNHTRRYWYESRLSNGTRFPAHGQHELLGKPVADWNPLDARWRRFLSTADVPWLEDHKVQNQVVMPGAGMIAMAIEATKQLANEDRHIVAFELTSVKFLTALVVPSTETVETQLAIRPRQQNDIYSRDQSWFEFRLFSFINAHWTEHCRGNIAVQYEHDNPSEIGSSEDSVRGHQNLTQMVKRFGGESAATRQLYRFLNHHGFAYGPAFQVLGNMKVAEKQAIANVRVHSELPTYGSYNSYTIHPITLDGIMQVVLASLTKGGTESIPTMVPTQIDRLRVSSSVQYSSPGDGQNTVNAVAEVTTSSFPWSKATVTVLDGSQDQVLLNVDGLRFTAVSGDRSGGDNMQPRFALCRRIDWQPDVTLLANDEISILCRHGSPPEVNQTQENQNIDRLIYLSWAEALRDWDENSRGQNVSTTVEKYVMWAKRQLNLYCPDNIQSQHLNDPNLLLGYRKEVEETSQRGKLYGLVSRKLPALLSGELDPLSLLFQDDLVSQFYQEMNNEISFYALSQYLALLTHQNPCMNMLEIGAGTGATTRIVMDKLQPPGNQDTNAHFKSYDFTDISPSFFEKARAEFGHLQAMNFKVLDVEQPPSEQGFELGTYDVVIAANVLHATKSLDETLRRVRSLLKDGGKLILIELVRPELSRTGFVFGLLQGWWLGVNDNREWGPLVTESEWNERLIRSGFSGTDLIFRESEQADCHEMSVLVSTATHSAPKEVSEARTPPLVVVLPNDQPLCHDDFKLQLEQATSSKIQGILPFDKVPGKELPSSAVFIFMLELGDSFISSISSQHFQALKKIFSNANGVIWVTRSGHDASPSYQMIEGLARTIRRENNQTTFLTVAFDTQSGYLSTSQIEKLGQIIKRADFEQKDISYDGDYFERDGKMHIGRVKVNKQLSDAVASHTLVETAGPDIAVGPGSSLALEVKIKTPGALDSLHFTNDTIYATPLKDDEVEIHVEASGVIFRDCLMASGKIPLTSFGLECAGLVTKSGAQSGFIPGQRVYGMANGTIKTFARLNRHCTSEIPTNLTFNDAASIPISFVTAYYSLSRMARVCPGDSMLIHSAAGGTGQAAIQVAKHLGVTKIFATVSTEEKKQYLMDTYGIPAGHIFNSRETSFADAIARMTKDGVDVVLNSLSGQGLLASWNCMAPHGRFVELGKRDIIDNNHLPMQPFLRNVSYIAVDIHAIVEERPRLLADSLTEISKLLADKRLHPIRPLKTFEFSKFGEAIHHMLSGRSVGKVVLVKEPYPSLPVMLQTETSLYSFNKSYIIAGGLGGVGRSIASWMVEHGARYLVLISRSGPSNLADKRFVEELQARGVTVKAPACDIADAGSLQSVIETVKNSMPPIAGCIQAAMVLKDSLFEKMSHKDWQAAVKPKVDGSWNLHALLPDNLDFFILLSSLGGIVGFSGQSNYAAGNSYQDALARYRRARGLNAVSVDLGGMFSDGYVSENEEVAERIFAPGYYTPLYRKDLFTLLGNLCRRNAQHDVQVLFGLTRPTQLSSDEFKTYSNGVLAPPLFSAMWNDHGASDPKSPATASAQLTLDFHSKFIQAQGEVEAGEIVAQATVRKLQGILPNMEKAEIWKPMLTYGVDSLVAVELRNWYSREFRAQVTAFDIMGGESFLGLGTRIAMLSELRKDKDSS